MSSKNILIIVIVGLLFSIPIVYAENKAPIADARIGYRVDEVNHKFVRTSVGKPVYFNGSLSFDPDGNIVEYYWNLDDGYTTTGAWVSHTYSTMGVYHAELMVTDDGGGFSVSPSTVTIEVNPSLSVRITKPGNRSKFIYKPGEVIEFVGEPIPGTPCYLPPHYNYSWRSDRMGVIGRGKEIRIEAMSLPLGWHKITLNITDCIGDTAEDSIEIVIVPELRAEILKLYDQESWYWERILYSNGTWDPDHHFSGGDSDILTLSPGYTRVILREACFDDEGYIEVNGNRVYENNDGCCSPGCHQVERDITEYVHPGNNTIYGYAEDCCGSYAYVSAYIQIDKIPSRRCSVLEEFSDGFREKILEFPPAGGSNSEAKITLPMNATICDAEVKASLRKKSDVSLDVGSDGVEWSHDNFIGQEIIADRNTNPKITDKLTQLLRDCNCPGCSKDGDYCTIDLRFATNHEVNLRVNGLHIVYCIEAGEATCPSCQINWTGRAKGGLPPYNVKWISRDDGLVDEFWIKNDGGTYTLYTTPPMAPPLRGGVHSIKFEVEDSIGLNASDIRHEIFVPWCCTVDTDCHTCWPEHEGPIVDTGNENAHSCDMYEVCHPDLWQLVREAILCCKWNCTPEFCNRVTDFNVKSVDIDTSCMEGYEYGAELGSTPEGLTQDGIKRCAGVYIINALGPTAKFMSDYWWPEICCAGNSYCCEGCCCGGPGLPTDLGKCRCANHVYTRNAQGLPCTGPIAGISPRGWKSDVAMNKNTCYFSDLPAHASILGDQGIVTEAEGINTGTCCDYSNALTTMLRIIGYNSTEVYSCTGPEHCYNLVKFPRESKWNLVDTTGNKDVPWTKQGSPGGIYLYCNYFNCRNDMGTFTCPFSGDVWRC